MGTEIEIKTTPTYDEIDARGGPQNALEQFVNENEPADAEQGRHYHASLAAALNFAQGRGPGVVGVLTDASSGGMNVGWEPGEV